MASFVTLEAVTMGKSTRIYITGASCAGVTTLGRNVAQGLGVRHVDTDDVYWMPTNPPYTTKRPPEERVGMIRQQLGEYGWVLSGSFDGWGDELINGVDLIVFVSTPTPVRMKRLMARELRRYGDRILPGGDMHETHQAFHHWASQYDRHGFTGRSLSRHEAWLSEQKAPVVRLNGTLLPNELGRTVISAIDSSDIAKIVATEPIIGD